MATQGSKGLIPYTPPAPFFTGDDAYGLRTGPGKVRSDESIALNDIVGNVNRLLIEDREWCTRRFPEGRPERWFFDDYQFIEGDDYNWYCGLAPPRSHWHTVSDGHDVYDTPHHKYTLEMEEKSMRLAGWLV